MTGIRWTRANRKKLHGFRRPHQHDPADVAPTLEAAWSRLVRAAEQVTVVGDDKLAATSRAVLEELRADAPPEELDVERELIRTAFFLGPLRERDTMKWESWAIVRDLVALWVERGGVAFAARVLDQPPAWNTFSSSRSPTEVVFQPQPLPAADELQDWDRDPNTGGPREHIGPYATYAQVLPAWWALRCRVSRMDEGAVAAASKGCAPLLEGLPQGRCCDGGWFRRAALLFALSRDRAVTADGIARLDAAWEGTLVWDGVAMLFAAAPDAATALALAHRSPVNPRVYAFDVVEAFEADAAPVLHHLFTEVRRHSALRYLKDVRAAIALTGAKV